ncbi:hypothetical protein [Burkholderia ambifaria]|uniref:hypothetical protein n=1 Tax=Burkholderia ambifaria TaxID=152480 RepID=UPI001FC8D57E|nr:hypothetical protein [Burkholderia ambifaria]
MQDLSAKVRSDNLVALPSLTALAMCDGQIDTDAPSVIHTPDDKQLKIKRTRAFAHFRQCVPRWLHEGIVLAVDELACLLRHLAANVVRFMGRNRPRPPKPKPHKPPFAAKTVM